MNKNNIRSLFIKQLQHDLRTLEQAVALARDTATHSDCLGSSKYETMGLEASYLAQGQGLRLLDIERSLTCFTQLDLSTPSEVVTLSSLLLLEDESGHQQWLWLAADAGGLSITMDNKTITVITLKSPLGKALIGKHCDDAFELNIAGTTREYQILSVC